MLHQPQQTHPTWKQGGIRYGCRRIWRHGAICRPLKSKAKQLSPSRSTSAAECELATMSLTCHQHGPAASAPGRAPTPTAEIPPPPESASSDYPLTFPTLWHSGGRGRSCTNLVECFIPDRGSKTNTFQGPGKALQVFLTLFKNLGKKRRSAGECQYFCLELRIGFTTVCIYTVEHLYFKHLQHWRKGSGRAGTASRSPSSGATG